MYTSYSFIFFEMGT